MRLLVVLLLLVCSASAADADVTLTRVPPELYGTKVVVAAFGTLNGDNYNETTPNWLPAALPFWSSTIRATDISSIHTGVSLTDRRFYVEYEFWRVRGSYNSQANVQLSSIYFTVDTDTNYEAVGWIDVVGDSGTVSKVGMSSRLTDMTTDTDMYYSFQRSYTTSSSSFVLGGLGGDGVPTMNGSLQGTLLPGHEYRYQAIASLQEGQAGTDTHIAVGGGAIALRLTPVPEPDGSLMMLAGTGLLAFIRHRTQ